MKSESDPCAGYICDMTKQLAKLARVNGMDQLASLLEIAALEAKTETRNGHDAGRR